MKNRIMQKDLKHYLFILITIYCFSPLSLFADKHDIRDLSGTYTDHLLGMDVIYDINQDKKGKIVGSEDIAGYDADYDLQIKMTLNVKGTVKQKKNVATVSMTLTGKGTATDDSNEYKLSYSKKIIGTINPDLLTIEGKASEKVIIRRFTSYRETFYFSMPLPVGVGNLLSDGLVAYYPFNGNATDASGNGNDGTVDGAILSTDRFGNENSAYSFDGIDDYIDIANSNELNFGEDDFTISIWLKYPSQEDGTHDYSAVINKAENPNNPYEGFTLFVDNPTSGQACFRTQYEYELYSNSNTLNGNTWKHFVLIRKNGRLNIYLDSVLDSHSKPPITDVSNNANIRLGANHIVSTSQNFTGDMDDIRLYNRALTKAEIKDLYNEGGLIDSDDSVPDMSLTVVIDGCDTGVEDHLLDDGYNISDSIAECAEGAKNYGSFVRCVAQMTKKLKKDGIISRKEEHTIRRCAVRAYRRQGGHLK